MGDESELGRNFLTLQGEAINQTCTADGWMEPEEALGARCIGSSNRSLASVRIVPRTLHSGWKNDISVEDSTSE